ncbi:MAG TPA: FG-GAP-like repeat-containing protein [Pyrinomonadaceae bacterium]|nr:FG-GAP-like repeat-containing protein [Pyrinomonadaceae bacterium]
MERRKSRAVFFVRTLPALVALVAACAHFAAPARARQTPAPSPAPAQTPQPRAGRSYDTAPPAKRTPAPAPQGQSPVTFKEIAAESGVRFRHQASPTSRKYLPETMGGGVALFDFDRDGRLDLFFTNGASLADPMPKAASPDKRDPRFWNRLYRQKADGTFEDLTERAGLRGEGYGMGAAAGDYDNDGWVDLYVTAYGGAVLYRNRGDGTFEDVTRKTATSVEGWPTSAGWLDYDRDGRLDLFVARYMDWDFERGALVCGSHAVPAYCHPDNFKGAANLLFRQKTDGTFEDVSMKAAIADSSGKGLGVAFADFDGDQLTDIFVANDSVRQFLHRNRGDGTFEDVGLLAGVGYDENGKTFAGMGVDAADYDNDGQPDVFITALSNETYPLFRNNGDLTFTYTTNTSGVGQITLLHTGWGTRFADFDNDGLRDLFVAQGHVLDTIEKTASYLTYRQTPLLMRNNGKNFVNVSASAGAVFNQPLAARGAAFGDLDNDGDTDVVLAQTDGPAIVLRNEGRRDGAKSHWLGVSLVGSKSNRQGLGARVVVTDAAGAKQVFDVTGAGSYLSSSDPRVLVGLGTRAAVRSVEVRWPSGITQTVKDPAIDKYLTINEK